MLLRTKFKKFVTFYCNLQYIIFANGICALIIIIYFCSLRDFYVTRPHDAAELVLVCILYQRRCASTCN